MNFHFELDILFQIKTCLKLISFKLVNIKKNNLFSDFNYYLI